MGRYRGEFSHRHILVDEYSIEEVIGKKLIEALGAINLLAGDDIVLGSLGNMQTATAGELVDMIGKVRRSIAAENQWLQLVKHGFAQKKRIC